MAPLADIFNLGTLRLSSGEAARVDLDVALEPLQFGGQTYRVEGERARVRVDVSRTVGAGFALRLRFDVALDGPCMRCLDDATVTIAVDAREVDQPGEGDEMMSPYLDDQDLQCRDWARDALVLALPSQILCREDCAGLCPRCGENLNQHPEHQHEPEPDPRWARLSELKLD
ncbi:MAG: YceD family protein [Thermoleophilaceae bacterium]